MELTIGAIIEIAGFPEQHVEKTMKMVLENLEKEKGIKVIEKSIAPVKQMDRMWSTFAELRLKIDNFNMLTDFCFNYMPSSIEILEPLKVNTDSTDIADLLNDLLARLHNFTMFLKNLQAENMMLKKEKGINESEKK